MDLKYTCKYCSNTNNINNVFRWFFTPHLGAKKWLNCKHCGGKKHFMKRQDWVGPSWLDWPKNS